MVYFNFYLLILFCFACLNSEESPKGTECYDTFKTMQECFAKYPAVYNKTSDDENDDLDAVMASSTTATTSTDQNNIESADQLDVPSDSTAAVKSNELVSQGSARK